MEVEGGEKGQRRIQLFCPCVSKIVQIIAWDEQKLDLGSISRAFGLDPNTLKLNGHFISRGVDLIASSVTWKSLIGFFSARGLSTGATDSDALLVDGKLSKVGSKRSCDLGGDAGDGVFSVMEEQGCLRYSKKPQLGSCCVLDNGSVKNSSSDAIKETTECNGSNGGSCLKRKSWLENESCLKRRKSDEAASERKGSTSTNTPSTCSFFSRNMKRWRGDEIIAASPLKKTRQ